MVKWGHWRGGGSRDLEWGLQVGPESPAAALGVDPLSAPPEDHVDLDIDEQCDNEGHVEGDYGGVDHKGGVGDDALALFCRRESPRRAGQQAQGPQHHERPYLLHGTRSKITETILDVQGCLEMLDANKCAA